MATVKSLLRQLRRGSCRGLAPTIKSHLDSADLVREYCSSTAAPIYRGRKRGRGQQGTRGGLNHHPPTIVSIATPDHQFHRRFSSTRAVIDEHTAGLAHSSGMDDAHHKQNHNDDNDDGTLEKQLDELLKGGGSFRSRQYQYQNFWKLPSSNREKTDSIGEPNQGSGIISNNQLPTPLHLFPLDSDKRLDRQSRFVLELLQTLQQVGLTNTSDRVTTERCNAILKRLATPQENNTRDRDDNAETPDDDSRDKSGESDRARGKQKRFNNPADKDVASMVDQWQRIERARAILDSMESYVLLQKNSRSQIPTELPVPSHETYFTLLKLYSSAKQLSGKDLDRFKTTSSENNTYAIALLEAANDAPFEAKAIVERMEASGKLALVPTSLHWNQVLSCHANAIRRPNRPLEAATLLYKLLQAQQDTISGFGGDGDGILQNADGTNRSKSTTEASSFAHVLRSCADGSALEDYETHRSGAPSKAFLRKEKEAFAKLALAVAQRVWKGLQQEQELERETTLTAETPPSKRQDHLSGLLDDDEGDFVSDSVSTDANPSSSSHRDAIAMNSHHFVHMLRAGRNFATLFSLEQQKREKDQPTENTAGRKLLELRQRHEEWMLRVFRECSQHQKVNIHVLQEVMYQGAVLLLEDSSSDGNDSTTEQDSDADDILDWVGRIVLPSADATAAEDVARVRSRWDTEIVPSLLESKAKQELSSRSSHRSRRRLESVYTSTIHQTRILLRCLPSRWSAKAD
jgi:hypothetical protein